MKPTAKSLIVYLLPLLVLLASCSQEDPSPARDYHRLTTHPVSDLTNTSATFSADIVSMGKEPVLEYGFAWGTTRPFIEMSSTKLVRIGQTPGAGKVTATVEHPFESKTQYLVRLYVKTQTTVVYGNTVTFEGK